MTTTAERIVLSQTYDVGNGLIFERLEGGVVRVKVTPSFPGGRELSYEIDENLWASLVLTMSAFNERPNDWHAFIAHHQGKSDLMEAAKKLEICKAIVSRFGHVFE